VNWLDSSGLADWSVELRRADRRSDPTALRIRTDVAQRRVLWSTIVAYLVTAARHAAATTGNIADQLLGIGVYLSAAPEGASSTGCQAICGP
jgi:hypothetical protein